MPKSEVLVGLEAGKKLLSNPKNWSKNPLSEPGKKCLLQAVGWGASVVVKRAITELFPAHILYGNGCVRFNDHPDTTHENVMAVIERAIEIEKNS